MSAVLVECQETNKTSGTTSQWTNMVGGGGVHLHPGDQIGLEMAALHAQGSDGDSVEITGQATRLGILDNTVRFNFIPFISHCGRATARLPYLHSSTDRGRTPDEDRLVLGLRCARLGEPDLHKDFSATHGVFGSKELPDRQYTFRLTLKEPGWKYSAGGQYVLWPFSAASPPVALAVSDPTILAQITVNSTRVVPPAEANGKEETGGIETFDVSRLGSYPYNPAGQAFPLVVAYHSHSPMTLLPNTAARGILCSILEYALL